MWNYLYFIVLVRVKNKTDYTGPESYVAQMIKVQLPSGQLRGHPPPACPGDIGNKGLAKEKELWEVLLENIG